MEQLCHIQEQLQLYVEESILRVSIKFGPRRSRAASQQQMIDICILCTGLKQYKRVGIHLMITSSYIGHTTLDALS